MSNPYFAHESRGTFIAAVLEGLPEAPAYFKHNAAANRRGPEAVAWDAAPTMIAASEDLMDPAQYYVVDMRDAEAYAAGHVPNSINIALRGRFETWTGIMVPWDARLVLVGDEAQMSEALLRLHRVGYHGACLTFGAWKEAGLPVRKNNMCPPQDLYEAMQAPDSPIVIDVRLPNEWMALRIGTIVNIPLSTLAEDAKIIARTEKVVTVCNSAYRSSMALGVLERLGFEKVCSLAGGSQAWLDAGLPVYEARGAGAAAAAPKRYVRLAERLSAAELKRMLLDVPGTFSLVDIRPPEQFADYRLPGAVNVAVADLLEDQGWLVGVGPLVVVDRDGSLAMMVAGILSQKTERTIKAVYGGLSAYWTESELPASGAFSGSSPAPSAPVPSPTATPATTPAKKKSAGC